ncbi:hypothetical protein L9F63_016636 [Diploptera punctata]|uniref:Replication factor A protein 3 n=1 Tax=Diploptera punctata TaxID=6984 RepID=A0AAD8EHL8_DIPPU|nr:hypothetical protein L9F63_016636 [Diploptera punctata]
MAFQFKHQTENVEPRTRVNGSALVRHIGKQVSILGNILSTNPNGVSIEIKTTDNHVVTVRMMEPIQEPLSGWVEFQGVAQGKNAVSSDMYMQRPSDITEKFDVDQYNEAVTLLNTISNPWTL